MLKIFSSLFLLLALVPVVLAQEGASTEDDSIPLPVVAALVVVIVTFVTINSARRREKFGRAESISDLRRKNKESRRNRQRYDPDDDANLYLAEADEVEEEDGLLEEEF